MTKNTTVILVHGAWHGAWCWQAVADGLRAEGCTVLTPDLPTQTATFEAYVDCVGDLVSAQPESVVLVGHSMAGMIISAVAEAMPERIQSLVYVCAYLPQNGESLMQLASAASTHHLSPYVQIEASTGLITLSPLADAIDLMYSRASIENKAQALSRCQPQALQPFLASVVLSHRFDSVSKKAIIGEHDRVIAPQDQRAMASRATTNLLSIASDHAPFYSCVSDLVQAIIHSER